MKLQAMLWRHQHCQYTENRDSQLRNVGNILRIYSASVGVWRGLCKCTLLILTVITNRCCSTLSRLYPLTSHYSLRFLAPSEVWAWWQKTKLSLFRESKAIPAERKVCRTLPASHLQGVGMEYYRHYSPFSFCNSTAQLGPRWPQCWGF
jgi:hypothetical protein